jgi:hypothetical protein
MYHLTPVFVTHNEAILNAITLENLSLILDPYKSRLTDRSLLSHCQQVTLPSSTCLYLFSNLSRAIIAYLTACSGMGGSI